MLPSQLEMDVDTNGLTEVLTFDERTPKLTGRLDRTAEENRSAAASQPPPTTVRLIDQSAAAHGVAPGLGGPSEQWLWAAASAHHMLFSFAFHIFCCQPQRDARMAAAEWRRYRLLAWNPLYWLAWLPTVVAIAVGRWFHAFFGQHNAIDEHETDLEFQARDARNSPAAPRNSLSTPLLPSAGARVVAVLCRRRDAPPRRRRPARPAAHVGRGGDGHVRQAGRVELLRRRRSAPNGL